jgi:N-acetylneuraminate synthase
MNNLCYGANVAWSALGKINFSRKPSEKANIQFRRSLYFVKDLRSGDIISEDSVKSVRPGFGLPPKFLKEVIGQKITMNILKNTPVKNEHLFNPIDL